MNRGQQWLYHHGNNLSGPRLRLHALALAAGLWGSAAYVLATPGMFDRNGILKGIDFLQFHTAARLVADGRASHLYDWQAFGRELIRAVPGVSEVLFVSVYPPQMALLLAPLGSLPYGAALTVWTCVSAALAGASVWTIARQFPEAGRWPVRWWMLAAAFVPLQQLLVHGQVSALALLLFAGAWAAMRHGRWALFGLLLGSLAFKPSFLVAPVLAMIVSRRLMVAVGAAAGAGLQVVLVSLALGPEVWWDYAEKVRELLAHPEVFEPKPWQMHSLKGFWQLLLGWGWAATVLWGICVVAVTVALGRIWRGHSQADLQMGALVAATVLVNPHLYVYDLVVLAVGLGALARWALDSPAAPHARMVLGLLHLLWWLPLAGPLAAVTRVQLTPLALSALLAVLLAGVRAAASPGPPIASPQSA